MKKILLPLLALCISETNGPAEAASALPDPAKGQLVQLIERPASDPVIRAQAAGVLACVGRDPVLDIISTTCGAPQGFILTAEEVERVNQVFVANREEFREMIQNNELSDWLKRANPGWDGAHRARAYARFYHALTMRNRRKLRKDLHAHNRSQILKFLMEAVKQSGPAFDIFKNHAEIYVKSTQDSLRVVEENEQKKLFGCSLWEYSSTVIHNSLPYCIGAILRACSSTSGGHNQYALNQIIKWSMIFNIHEKLVARYDTDWREELSSCKNADGEPGLKEMIKNLYKWDLSVTKSAILGMEGKLRDESTWDEADSAACKAVAIMKGVNLTDMYSWERQAYDIVPALVDMAAKDRPTSGLSLPEQVELRADLTDRCIHLKLFEQIDPDFAMYGLEYRLA